MLQSEKDTSLKTLLGNLELSKARLENALQAVYNALQLQENLNSELKALLKAEVTKEVEVVKG